MHSITTFWKPLNEYLSKNRIWLRFILITLIIAAGIWKLLYLDWVNINIVTPYAIVIARACGKLLQFFISDVQVQDSVVVKPPEFAMIIGAKCTGLFQIAFLVAGIVATPAKNIQKLSGIFLGVIVLSGINLFRLLTVFLVGCYALKYLDIFHDIIWEALMIMLTFFIWYIWRKLSTLKSNLRPATS